jgi:tripartite-type tricarboxylate transporter receptor subunit TctC
VAAEQKASGIELVVPTAAEGSTDQLARLIAAGLTRKGFGDVNVHNMPGRSGTLAASHVAASAPDGRTLLVATPSSHGIASAFENKMAYDPVRSFTPIIRFAAAPYLLVMKPGSVGSLAQFVDKAQAAQGQWRYSSTGIGGPHHLIAELYFQSVGLSLHHVPAKGGSAALAQVIDGNVEVMLPAAILALPRIQQGQLKALAVTGKQRLKSLPEVPTFTELGTPVDVVSWYGLMGPAGIPDAQAKRLATAVQETLAEPTVQAKLSELGIDKTADLGTAFSAVITSEVSRWKALVGGLGIRSSEMTTDK